MLGPSYLIVTLGRFWELQIWVFRDPPTWLNFILHRAFGKQCLGIEQLASLKLHRFDLLPPHLVSNSI